MRFHWPHDVLFFVPHALMAQNCSEGTWLNERGSEFDQVPALPVCIPHSPPMTLHHFSGNIMTKFGHSTLTFIKKKHVFFMFGARDRCDKSFVVGPMTPDYQFHPFPLGHEPSNFEFHGTEDWDFLCLCFRDFVCLKPCMTRLTQILFHTDRCSSWDFALKKGDNCWKCQENKFYKQKSRQNFKTFRDRRKVESH